MRQTLAISHNNDKTDVSSLHDSFSEVSGL